MTTLACDYHRPRTIEEASSILLEGGARAALLAGGTDLVVRLKRSLRSVDVVVDLAEIDELRRLEETVDGMWLGAMVTAADVARQGTMRARFPAVAEAARSVGGLQIRHMATVGGALASGLRCQFRDQSSFWRATLGACLAAGGGSCHARPGDGCVATVACDLPPAIAASEGQVVIAGPRGRRTSSIGALSTGDGTRPLRLAAGEVIVGVILPWKAGAPWRSSVYMKTRLRRAVDRPLVGLALSAELADHGELVHLSMSVCGNGPAVTQVPGLEPFIGARLEQPVADAIGRHVSRWFEPSPAIRIDVPWRRAVAGVMARRALESIARGATRRARRSGRDGERATRRS